MTMGDTDPAASGPFYRPYRNPAPNQIYNLLFCDNADLFRQGSGAIQGPLGSVLSSATEQATLEDIGNDATMESRVRMLAFNRLRALKVPVTPKCLLGVVIEVPQQQGLDTLAAFADGRLRYINYSEKMEIFEANPPSLTKTVEELQHVSQLAVNRIGPWDKPRLPPPEGELIRMTFLVSDGLYFGQGPFTDMQRDPIAGPIIRVSGELLSRIVDVALEREKHKA
jgi:hypothetical protein